VPTVRADDGGSGGGVAVVSAVLSALFNANLRRRYAFRLLKHVEGVAVYVPQDRRARELFEGTLAFALGNDVYVVSTRAFTAVVRRHELEHVQQFRREGVLFFLRYWWADYAVGYWANPYERAARRAERLSPRKATGGGGRPATLG